MLHKILKFFGLVTIKQAKHINRETALLLHRTVARMVRDDFGVGKNPDAEEFNRQWADECFDQIIDHEHPTRSLVGAWEITESFGL